MHSRLFCAYISCVALSLALFEDRVSATGLDLPWEFDSAGASDGPICGMSLCHPRHHEFWAQSWPSSELQKAQLDPALAKLGDILLPEATKP